MTTHLSLGLCHIHTLWHTTSLQALTALGTCRDDDLALRLPTLPQVDIREIRPTATGWIHTQKRVLHVDGESGPIITTLWVLSLLRHPTTITIGLQWNDAPRWVPPGLH